MHFKLWKSSLQWTAALIQKLWDIAWDMWEHQNKALHVIKSGYYTEEVLNICHGTHSISLPNHWTLFWVIHSGRTSMGSIITSDARV